MVKCILCISPNKAMNYLILTVLNKLYEVVIAEEVFHGMNLLQQKKEISLIIIDIDYHLKESADFILHINSSKMYHKPLIFLTSAQNHKSNASLMEECVYRYFIKPFNPTDLVNYINSIDAFKPSTSLS